MAEARLEGGADRLHWDEAALLAEHEYAGEHVEAELRLAVEGDQVGDVELLLARDRPWRLVRQVQN